MNDEGSHDVIPQKAHSPAPADALRLVVPDPALASPSLSASELPAYELKFLLSEAQAREVEALARGSLVPDPHADPARGGAYETTSLYCDTAQLDVFYRRGSFGRRKHRVRRYGDAGWVFLERKSKWGDRVKKLRTSVPLAELSQLGRPASAADWPGHWFHRHLAGRGLRPACVITYERVALVGLGADGPLRLTFDRQVRGARADAWALEGAGGGLPLLTGQVICEFKYRACLPALFKDVLHALRLTPCPVSKYRSFVRAAGLLGGGGPADA